MLGNPVFAFLRWAGMLIQAPNIHSKIARVIAAFLRGSGP
jgi:hypothetical protein